MVACEAMKVGIVGFGNMGRAIAAGLRRSDGKTELFVYDAVASQTGEAGSVGAKVCAAPAEICAACDLLVIAVKPQNVEQLVADFRAYTEGIQVLSIVAGRRISFFRAGLGTNQVVRCMPNLAATVGRALVGVTIPNDSDELLRSRALEVARAMGTPVEVPEEQLAAITGISGSGIGYVFSFVHALALGGTRAGLAYPTALRAAIEVLQGACTLLEGNGEHPISWLSKVTSPAGTTIAGIKALEEGAFTASVMEAVEQAAKRAAELEG